MWQEPRFDKHAFERRPKVVSATKTKDGWDSNGLSFADRQNMHLTKREVQAIRRIPTPTWAVNDEQLRAVMLRYAEDRLYIRDHAGTDAERLARIQAETARVLPGRKKHLEDMLADHAKLGEQNEKVSKSFALQVQSLDTDIRVLERGIMAPLTAIVYSYYRQGKNSVEVAEEFGFRSPMVRMWLYRMHSTASKVFGGATHVDTTKRDKEGRWRPNHNGVSPNSIITTWSKEKLLTLFALKMNRINLDTCARVLGEARYNVNRAWRYHFGDLKVGAKKTTPQRRATPQRPRNKWTDEMLSDLKWLRSNGVKFREIADVLGIVSKNPTQAVQYAFMRYGKG